jgi:tRNA modification GTPase
MRHQGTIIDEVLVTVFRTPHSFTKEDSVEISCHGSDYIVRQLLKVLVTGGGRVARPGEFTQRAFLNGQFDLVQAEAVADLIAADSELSHRTAITQLRGGFSKKLQGLREELIHFASLVELELDFGEEDVQFAERDDLRLLIQNLQGTIRPLIDSFDFGNAIKDGVPVAIIGSPNVGKSTLLNAFLNEEKAIVTDIAGTTRDVIEDILVLEGMKYRFIDTAGIRETQDVVESLGIERSRNAIEKADVVLLLFDSDDTLSEIKVLADSLPNDKKVIWVQNKADLAHVEIPASLSDLGEVLRISAKTQRGLDELRQAIVAMVQNQSGSDTVVTNMRHYEHLIKTSEALTEVVNGLDNGITGDFLAQDIRLALYHLGEITGTIVSDDLLANIFSKFCIGK